MYLTFNPWLLLTLFILNHIIKGSNIHHNPIVEKCSSNFFKIYEDCHMMRLIVDESFSDSASYDTLLNMLSIDNVENIQVIRLEYNSFMTISTTGIITDLFLQKRPEWIVYHEDFLWQKTSTHHVIYIRVIHLEKQLREMANYLNPSNCNEKLLIIRGYNDFNEWGNEHWNTAAFYQQFLGTVSILHFANQAAFIENDYCPHEINKYNCGFIPLTNCTLPSVYLNCQDLSEECTPGHFVYSSADADAQLITNDYDVDNFWTTIPRIEAEEIPAHGDLYRSISLYNFENVATTRYKMDGPGSLFYVAMVLRRNFDFRSKAAKIIHEFRRSSKFLPNDICVAIHIRHHDRVLPGYDMLKYCREFVIDADGFCRNSTTNELFFTDEDYKGCPIQYYDYGCSSVAPFGAISFESYLKAAEVVMEKPAAGLNASRTVFIMTDDGDWVRRESEPFRHEWSIHVLPAPPNHRGRAAINGATLFASFELAQQCTGLVGHSISAISVLLKALMCFKSGPKNSIRFGECPRFYDFRYLR